MDHEQYKDWRKDKYTGKDGLLYKGLVSSNDDVLKDTYKQTVRVNTQNSSYYFTNVSEIGDIDVNKLY